MSAASFLLPNDAVAIGVGAFCGAMARYQCGRLAGEYIAANNRVQNLQGWHTAAINIGGSFLLGGVAGAPTTTATTTLKKTTTASTNATFLGFTPRAKLCLGVGFCGSFTTFSTYSVDVVTWLAQGQTTKAVSYVLTNNVGGVMAAAAGMVLVKKLF